MSTTKRSLSTLFVEAFGPNVVDRFDVIPVDVVVESVDVAVVVDGVVVDVAVVELVEALVVLGEGKVAFCAAMVDAGVGVRSVAEVSLWFSLASRSAGAVASPVAGPRPVVGSSSVAG